MRKRESQHKSCYLCKKYQRDGLHGNALGASFRPPPCTYTVGKQIQRGEDEFLMLVVTNVT